MRAALVAVLAFSIASCSLIRPDAGEGVAATALPYKTRMSRGEDRRDVTVSAEAPGATVEAVRESVRFEATRYCLTFFGASEADWTIDPATGDWAFVRDGDDMIFTARCTAR